MPIYEYKCEECNNKFSELVRNHDDFIECPKCNSGFITKLISAPGFVGTKNCYSEDKCILKEKGEGIREKIFQQAEDIAGQHNIPKENIKAAAGYTDKSGEPIVAVIFYEDSEKIIN